MYEVKNLKFGDICWLDWSYNGFMGMKKFKGLAVYVAPGTFIDPKSRDQLSVVEAKVKLDALEFVVNIYDLPHATSDDPLGFPPKGEEERLDAEPQKAPVDEDMIRKAQGKGDPAGANDPLKAVGSKPKRTPQSKKSQKKAVKRDS